MKDKYVLLVWEIGKNYVAPSVFGTFENRALATNELMNFRRSSMASKWDSRCERVQSLNDLDVLRARVLNGVS